MKTHNIEQGSAVWHEFRAKHLNASDAPAMMGVSPYKSRAELLREKSTGLSVEVDSATQRRFNDGHRFEALARPVAEKIIGEELSPVVGSEGKYAASFDGITMLEDVIFEHKTYRDDIAMALGGNGNTGGLPEHYRIQMEHQLMVSGAEKCLFMASRWNGEELADSCHGWYIADHALRNRILAGWEQFEKDLASYQHVEIAEKPKADVVIELPALFVHARGEITEHNMEAFGQALTTRLAEVRAIALVTDQDFSNAKEAAKKFRETAKAIALSKEQMLAQTETIGEAARKMDAWAKDLNATALQLEKDVEREDLAKKRAMVDAGMVALAAHIEALEAETKPIRLDVIRPDFAAAIKGKRNYASMQDAVDTALANGKIEADAKAKDVRDKLAWCKEHAAGMSFLFPDLQHLIVKQLDDFKLVITSRIDQHKAAEAEKAAKAIERIEAEARAKAEREAAEKLAAEEARIRAEERAKAEAEARAKIEAEAKSPAQNTPEEAIAPACQSGARPAAIAQTEPAAPIIDNGKTLKLGEINARLGFTVSADFLASLGFEAKTEKNAKLYRECDFPRICAAIIRHVQGIDSFHAMDAAD